MKKLIRKIQNWLVARSYHKEGYKVFRILPDTSRSHQDLTPFGKGRQSSLHVTPRVFALLGLKRKETGYVVVATHPFDDAQTLTLNERQAMYYPEGRSHHLDGMYFCTVEMRRFFGRRPSVLYYKLIR